MRRTVVRLATWNVWWRFGEWQRRQGPIARTLGEVDADVVVLQEAWTTSEHDQAARLADHLQLPHVDQAWRYRGPDGVSIGNAVLSRWPLEDRLDVGVPGPFGRFRTLLAVTVVTPDGTVRVATTHLAHRQRDRGWRRVQVAKVDGLLRPGSSLPTVLAGDLNAEPEEREMAWLARWGWRDLVAEAGLDDDRTWRSDNPGTAASRYPDRRLDHVLGRGVHAECVRLFALAPVDGTHPSDHAGLVADLVPSLDRGTTGGSAGVDEDIVTAGVPSLDQSSSEPSTETKESISPG